MKGPKSLEDSILGFILIEPDRLKDVALQKSFFKSQRQRLVFDELQRGNTDAALIIESLMEKGVDGAAKYVENLLFDPLIVGANGLQPVINKVKISRLNVAAAQLVNEGAARGHYDHEKIRGIYNAIEALEFGGPESFGYPGVSAKEISWLWPGRIPFGMITLVAGHPGVGKSFFATWLAAFLSRGGTLPGSGLEIAACSTFLIASEEDPGRTIKPRLMGNAADCEKIFGYKDPEKFSLDSLADLRLQIKKNPDICLVIVDPLTAFLGAKTDYFRDPDIRHRLTPLAVLARQTNVAVLAVVHFNKKEDSEIITRIGGSIAIAGVARSILGVSYDTRDTGEDSRDTRLLSSLKMNLARTPDTLAFKISEDLKITFDPRPVRTAADAIFSRETRERRQRKTAAESWLMDYLEPRLSSTSKDAVDAAEEEGIPRTTLYRAKKNLEAQGLIETVEAGFGKDRRGYWKIPGPEPAEETKN